jgi:hypothetical protein
MDRLAKRVALKFATGADLRDVLDLLEDLRTLDENLSDVQDTFQFHYAAAMNPEVTSQLQALNKAREGLAKALEAQKALKRIVELFAEDKTAARALLEAGRMVDKFEKHVNTAKEMVRKLSKKEIPEALKKLSKQVESAIESRLIDPSKLEVFAWQTGVTNYRTNVSGVQFQMRFRVNLPREAEEGDAARIDLIDLVLSESTVEEAGVLMGIAWRGERPLNVVPASKNGAVDLLLDAVKGWTNIKGESEAQTGRKPAATAIAAKLTAIFRNRPATVSQDNRVIEAETRDDSLPKEGAYSVGEYEYEQMVARAIKSLRQEVEKALSPWSNNIAKISIQDGEKSWLYITVELK